MRTRRTLALFLPAAVLAIALGGLVAVVAQQGIRTGANDPQEQLATDAAARLDRGAAPATVVGPILVDVARDLGPFVVVYDQAGSVLATDGRLDGLPPVVPAGVLVSARSTGRDAVTWQPRPGIRIATVTIPWGGGTVLAGRSLHLAEERTAATGLLVVAGLAATLVTLLVASFVAAAIWPTVGRRPELTPAGGSPRGPQGPFRA